MGLQLGSGSRLEAGFEGVTSVEEASEKYNDALEKLVETPNLSTAVECVKAREAVWEFLVDTGNRYAEEHVRRHSKAVDILTRMNDGVGVSTDEKQYAGGVLFDITYDDAWERAGGYSKPEEANRKTDALGAFVIPMLH